MTDLPIAFAAHPANPRFIDQTGREYGSLRVLGYAGGQQWWCRCGGCGGLYKIGRRSLNSGTKQCRECAWLATRGVPKSHGHNVNGCRHPLYIVWSSMIQRCHNSNNRQFDDYGGRGITVCQRWRDSFADFLADVGERPTDRHSLDRKDNDLGYSPDNCRWATRTQQNRNSRKCRMLTFQGQTRCLKEWSEHLGIPYTTLHSRLAQGWPVERLLRRPDSKRPAGAR